MFYDLFKAGEEPYNIKMPSKKLRAKNVLITYNGNFTREEVRDHLVNKGVNVDMVVRNDEGHPHIHVIASKGDYTYWTPNEFEYMQAVPDITMQKHEGGKAGLYDYLRSQDNEPLYVSVTENDIDKMKKIRKINESSKVGGSMPEAIEKLSTCATMEDVDALWAAGELPQNKTSKVWREEWTTLQRVKLAKETKELESIGFRIPVEFKPTDMESVEWQNIAFNYNHDMTMEFTDVTGKSMLLSKKIILSIHGEPGVGKTPCVKMALENNGIRYYRVPANSQPMQWFDGYMGEPVIWCDDCVMPSPSQFLNLLESDKLPIKGGFVPKDWFRVRWIITNNLCLRSQFNSYKTETDRIKVGAIWARTQEIMMYPNEELKEQQRNLFVYRGRIIDDKQEYIKLCRKENQMEVEEMKKTEYQELERRFEQGDVNLIKCIDGIKEKIQMGDKTVYLHIKPDGSKTILA